MSNRKLVGKDQHGKEIYGVPVIPTGTQESWNIYLLEDGSRIKLKIVAHEIYRLEGQWDQEGNPVYTVKSQQVISVDCPEELRRKGD